MQATLPPPIAQSWQMLANHYGWLLPLNSASFYAYITSHGVTAESVSEDKARQYAIEFYNIQIYQGLQQRDEYAAQALMAHCYRVALGRGLKPDEAQEIASEAILRVIEHLDSIRFPQTIQFYAFRILGNLIRALGSDSLVSLETDLNQSLADTQTEPLRTDAIVEQHMINSELEAFLRRKLPNQLEFLVIIRMMLYDDRPRDVAADVDLPLHRTRLAKHRALSRLRADDEFMAFCRSLISGE